MELQTGTLGGMISASTSSVKPIIGYNPCTEEFSEVVLGIERVLARMRTIACHPTSLKIIFRDSL